MSSVPARFRILSQISSVVILLVAWNSMADLRARTLLRLILWVFKVKILRKSLEEQICEVCLLLALQNEVQRRHSSSLIDSIYGLANLCIEINLEIMDHSLLFKLATLCILLWLGCCILVKKSCSLFWLQLSSCARKYILDSSRVLTEKMRMIVINNAMKHSAIIVYKVRLQCPKYCD